MRVQAIGVESVTAEDGSVQVQRVRLSGKWRRVSQGRQWVSPAGRHVLIMLEGKDVREILLRSDTLSWELAEGQPGIGIV